MKKYLPKFVKLSKIWMIIRFWETAHLPLPYANILFLAEIFEKVSFDPYNFQITRLSARKSEQMKTFLGDKNIPVSTV